MQFLLTEHKQLVESKCVFCGQCDSMEYAHCRRNKQGKTPREVIRLPITTGIQKKGYRSMYDKLRALQVAYQATYLLCKGCHYEYDRGSLKNEIRRPTHYVKLELGRESRVLDYIPRHLMPSLKPNVELWHTRESIVVLSPYWESA